MTTPTIEIIASETLETELRQVIATMEGSRFLNATLPELKSLLCDVVRARCIKRRFDEQQISLRLPSP